MEQINEQWHNAEREMNCTDFYNHCSSKPPWLTHRSAMLPKNKESREGLKIGKTGQPGDKIKLASTGRRYALSNSPEI